ncbi:MAG: leucine-rich repeat domain-containing protein, partial [Candidatus Hermodarchaeota archaeon]
MIEIFASFVMYLGVTIFVCIMSYSNTDFESFGEFKEKHPILLVVFWFIVSSIYGVISAFSTFVVIFFIRDVPLGFICSAVFWGTFFVAYMWVNIHGRGIRKFEEIGIEGLAVLPFAAMVGISVTFSFVFSIILIFTFLGASLSPTISSALSLTLFGQFIIILLYPLYEFLIFAKEGKQATEIYHRSVEKITDYIRTRIKPADFDANEAILDRYSLITGSIFYLVLFFVLIPLGAIFALMLFNKTTDLGSFIWFTFLLYPTIILGYYASLGVFDNLRPLVYLRKYTSLKNWFGLIVFLFACYSFITFTTGISLSQLFTILIRIFFPDFAFPDWLALLLLFVPIMASIFLVSLGLYKDYWKVKPPTRLLDYLFTAYLFSTLATLVFITFLTSHPNILITGLTLQSSNFLLGLLTIIEEIAITLLIIGLLLLGRRKYSQIDHTERPVLLWIEYQIGESIPQLSQMEETSFGFVVEENHITGLGLYNKNLKTLPKDINRLSQLNVLSLGQSQLRELPNALEELSNLQALNLRENHLKSILPSLKLPQTLQKLNLADNKLDSLPESLKNQINLEWLNLNGNQLQILPEWLGELSNLQVLGLLGNRLQTLPETFFQLTNLQTLDLSYNEFTSLPESFGNLSNLMWLNLNSNQLTVLPEWFGRLIRLQSLGLGNNQLETLPTSFGNLKKLKEVYLFDNQLTKLPNEIGQLSSLQILQLANNNLEFLPETIENLDKLTSLNLHENPLISLRGTLNNLKRPPKKYTQVNEPDATILFLLECLVGKEIPQISEIDKDIFGFTLEKGRVTNLRLSKQGLMVLPESFSQLTQLVELNLENNQLERLPKSFGQLTQLVALNLSHNKLDSLPDSFSQLTNLQLLNLTNNQLEDLPESF